MEEREAAYAEARMRIFGSADSTDTDKKSSNDCDGVNISRQIRTLKVAESVSIIRQPKGPDGSKGFENR